MGEYEFSDHEKECVEEFFDILDSACHSLQEETGCPDEAIDHLLNEAIGTWQLPDLEQLQEAFSQQEKIKDNN